MQIQRCKCKPGTLGPLRFENVFFDLDGTMTDPREGIVRSMQHAIMKLGLSPLPVETLECTIGQPLRDVFAKLLPSAGANSVEQIERAVGAYRERFSRTGLFENSLHGGLPTALSALLDSGALLFVVTSKPTAFARRILDHFSLTSYFKNVYGSEQDGMRTDKGDLIKYVLECEGISPQRAVMVGDRAYDIEGARSTGVKSIGVLWGFGNRHELTEAGAWKLCESFDELLGILSRSGDS